jgi:hypothetical protein
MIYNAINVNSFGMNIVNNSNFNFINQLRNSASFDNRVAVMTKQNFSSVSEKEYFAGVLYKNLGYILPPTLPGPDGP